METAMTDLLQVYEDGQDAAWHGLTAKANPYPEGSEEAEEWSAGLNDPRGGD